MDERGSGPDGLEPDVYPAPKGLWQRVQRSEVWRSVFRHPQLDTPRGRALQSFSNFFLHVYPVKVPGRVLRFRYSWRLGYILTVLFAITYLTGIYLMFFYTPSVASAYGDMQQLRTGIGFGQLVRNVHRWSAHLMVLVVVLHLARVFFAGAYKRPRQFNWVLGVGLLLATLGLSFSGYLLPWDQLSYWAVTVGTNLVNYVPAVGRILRDLLLGGAPIGRAAQPPRSPAAPTSASSGSACLESSTVSPSPPRSGAWTTPCSPGRTCWSATWSWAWRRRRWCSRSAWPSPRRCAGSPTPTSLRSRPRPPGTSSGSRNCCRTSTRSSPASSFRPARSWGWPCCPTWTATRPPRPAAARWRSCSSPRCWPSRRCSPSSARSSVAPDGGLSPRGGTSTSSSRSRREAQPQEAVAPGLGARGHPPWCLARVDRLRGAAPARRDGRGRAHRAGRPGRLQAGDRDLLHGGPALARQRERALFRPVPAVPAPRLSRAVLQELRALRVPVPRLGVRHRRGVRPRTGAAWDGPLRSPARQRDAGGGHRHPRPRPRPRQAGLPHAAARPSLHHQELTHGTRRPRARRVRARLAATQPGPPLRVGPCVHGGADPWVRALRDPGADPAGSRRP